MQMVSRGKPLRIHSNTTHDELECQLSKYIVVAWYSSENPSLSIREVGLQLLLDLEIITDTDLIHGGRDGAAFRNRAISRQADELIKTGQARNKREAATIIWKAPNQNLELGTIRKLLSASKFDAPCKGSSLEPRSIRRRNDHVRVVRALETAVARLEKTYEL
jgi:hypothetical protein